MPARDRVDLESGFSIRVMDHCREYFRQQRQQCGTGLWPVGGSEQQQRDSQRPCTNTVGVTGNTVNVLAGALDAIRLQARGRGVINARINTNVSNGGGAGFRGLEIRQASQTISAVTYTATFNLEGLTTGLQTNYNTIVIFAEPEPGHHFGELRRSFVTGING